MEWNQIYKEKGIVQSDVLDIVKKYKHLLPDRKINILDMGCGTGRHTFYLAENKKYHLIALDMADSGLKHIQGKQKGNNIENIVTIKNGFKNLPFEDKYFGALISTKAVHHGAYTEVKKFLEEAYRVVEKNGLILLVTLSDKDFRAKTGEPYKNEQNTRIKCDNLPDYDIPHHFFSETEIKECFDNKYNIIYKKIVERVAMEGLKASMYYDLILQKK